MGDARRGRALMFAALTTLLLAGLLALAQAQLGGDTPAGAAHVRAVFWDDTGYEFHNATLTLVNATALDALDAAAADGGFTYAVERYAGYGDGDAGVYVVEINGTRAERGDADGWIYRVHRDGEWLTPDRSAGVWPMHDGDTLVWAWTTAWNARMGR